MTDFAFRVATAADAQALSDLANQYTFQNLDEAARQQGFLTGVFTAPAMQAMVASVPSQVAYQGQELAGFIINSKLPPERYPPLVQQISALLPSLFYRQLPLTEYRWFFYGPVLVRQEHRGQGLLQQLFEANKQELKSRFNLGIAFIAEANAVSLQLHTQKLGLEIVGNIDFQGTPYAILVFPVS
jgi:GNAT superfamily N-acetyltransferase